MELIKVVPQQRALDAAFAAVTDSHEDLLAWQTWALSTVDTRLAVREDVLRGLLPDVPDNPVGRAWRRANEESLDLAAADTWRPFDLGRYTTATETGLLAQLDEVVERLVDRSALLGPVADVIGEQVSTGPFELGDIPALRAHVTGEAVYVGTRRDPVPDEPGDRPAWVPWAEVDLLAPGTRTRVVRILKSLDTASRVDVGEHDNGQARGHVDRRATLRP